MPKTPGRRFRCGESQFNRRNTASVAGIGKTGIDLLADVSPETVWGAMQPTEQKADLALADESAMTAKTFHDLYRDELKQICSANAQLLSIVTRMAEKSMDSRLMQGLEKTAKGIARHTATFKMLLGEESGDGDIQERCPGMTGLVQDALQRIDDEASNGGELLDLIMVAHYQRMSHFGIASFNTAAAYAKALDETHAAEQIMLMIREIEEALGFSARFAEAAQVAAALSDATR